eukprot:13999.XXX_653131_653325_1 [CDS] Oithona nana genome sequencing.
MLWAFSNRLILSKLSRNSVRNSVISLLISKSEFWPFSTLTLQDDLSSIGSTACTFDLILETDSV